MDCRCVYGWSYCRGHGVPFITLRPFPAFDLLPYVDVFLFTYSRFDYNIYYPLTICSYKSNVKNTMVIAD